MYRITKKLFSIFNRAQKIRIGIIFVLMIIGAGFETIGVSLIVPLMTTLMKPDFFTTDKTTMLIARLLDLHSPKTYVMALLLGMIVVYILKNIFLYLEYYVQQRFICNNRVYMQHRIMRSILMRPYEYFLGTTTGEIQRTIISDVEGVFGLLNNFMLLSTETVVGMVLVVAIFVINPFMALLVFIIIMIEVMAIGFVIKPLMHKNGEKLRDVNAGLNKWIIQAVSGIKETKVNEKEGFFLTNYQRYAKDNAKITCQVSVLGNVPRLIIEAVTISAMLGLIVILLFRGESVENLMPQLSAFAVAAVRLLPSANRISSAANALPGGEPSLDALIATLNEVNEWEASTKKEKKDENTHFTVEHECRMSHVTFAYSNSDKNILEDASMVIPAGKSIGIIGPSGSGKTTTVDLLLGLLKAQKGSITADGVSITENYSEWLSKIAYIPQSIYMIDDTIAANVAFGEDPDDYDYERVRAALKMARLTELIAELPDGIDTQIGERGMRLSGGQRQRIGIARALYTNPSILVFDEATSALDNETEEAIMESINSLRGQKTMIMIAHRLTTVKDCDIIYKVENGKITGTTL